MDEYTVEGKGQNPLEGAGDTHHLVHSSPRIDTDWEVCRRFFQFSILQPLLLSVHYLSSGEKGLQLTAELHM